MLNRAVLALVLSACSVALGAQNPAPQPAAAALRDRLQAKFEELHRAATVPGGTAGFVLADGSSFGLAVGVSDRTSKTPMRVSDRLLLGSVGKTYVSAVALQMMHEGKFSLDDTLDRFFAKESWFPYLLDAKPQFAPGQGWEYSDTNYIILGMIIEKTDARFRPR